MFHEWREGAADEDALLLEFVDHRRDRTPDVDEEEIRFRGYDGVTEVRELRRRLLAELERHALHLRLVVRVVERGDAAILHDRADRTRRVRTHVADHLRRRD